MWKKINEFFTWLLHSEHTPTVSERYEINNPVEEAKRTHKRWSAEETADLVSRWEDDQSLEYIAYAYTRTLASIQRKLHDLGYSVKIGSPRVPTHTKIAFVGSVNPVEEVPTTVKPVTLADILVELPPLSNAGKAWSKKDDQYLNDLYELNATIPQLMAAFGRTEASIIARIKRVILKTKV